MGKTLFPYIPLIFPASAYLACLSFYSIGPLATGKVPGSCYHGPP